MLGTTTKLSMLFQVLKLWLHMKVVFSGLGLTVTEINIKSKKPEISKCIKIQGWHAKKYKHYKVEMMH